MRQTPDARIQAVCGPDEAPTVVFVASHLVRAACFYVLLIGGFVMLEIFASEWSMMGVALAVALTLILSQRWLNSRYTVGVVDGDFVVVHDEGAWGWPHARLIGRWSSEAAGVELLEGRVNRIRIAGTTYWLNDAASVRARLAISAARRFART